MPAPGEAAFAAAREAHGRVRILVNCAGIGTAGRIVGRDGPMKLAAFERVIRVNLIGSFNMLRLAAAEMSEADPLEEGERGVIVNTASIAAYEGQVGQPAYAASKGGVVAMTLPAARELARVGVRVVTIAPGLFHTPMVDGLPAEVQASLGAGDPVPVSAWAAVGVCRAGGAHRAEPVFERRGDPAGRGVADATSVRGVCGVGVRLGWFRVWATGGARGGGGCGAVCLVCAHPGRPKEPVPSFLPERSSWVRS